MFDDGHVFGPMAGSQTRQIVVDDHTQDSV
jgi:hypothetical protein